MKWVLWLLAAGALVMPSALADVNDLSNGALITHHLAAAQYSTDAPAGGWCASYSAVGCDTQVNQIPGTNEGNKLWFVLAAWNGDEAKVCPSVEFGITYTPGNGVDTGYGITEQGTCWPGPSSGLEIVGTGWPAPGTGIALTCAPDEYWIGSYVPIYYFWGYTYGSGTIDLIPDPQVSPAFIGFSSLNQIESPVGPDFRGKMGLGVTAGLKVCPPTVTPGACCFDGGNDCQFVLEAECAGLGGHFRGEGTVCDPNPCPTIWACCAGGQCYMLSQTECGEYGGGWISGKTCAVDINCALYHVCCIETTCLFVTEDECMAQSGSWVTDPLFPSCATGCPVPVEKTSWSTIKAIYR